MSDSVFTPEQVEQIKAIVRELLDEPTGVVPRSGTNEALIRELLPEITQAVYQDLRTALDATRPDDG